MYQSHHKDFSTILESVKYDCKSKTIDIIITKIVMNNHPGIYCRLLTQIKKYMHLRYVKLTYSMLYKQDSLLLPVK